VHAYWEDFAQFPSNSSIFMPCENQVCDVATLEYLVNQETANARGSRERGLEALNATSYRGDIAREKVRFCVTWFFTYCATE